ncbi:MAG: hypothetical protein MZV49_18620 [Rhodopseudomonas palustris]|nr:hypothetical protein [Rhodopseudomonas palustris]
MSQAFSLYGELTVRQNLVLHARLFQLPRRRDPGPRRARWSQRFGLDEVMDATARRRCRSASASACRWRWR